MFSNLPGYGVMIIVAMVMLLMSSHVGVEARTLEDFKFIQEPCYRTPSSCRSQSNCAASCNRKGYVEGNCFATRRCPSLFRFQCQCHGMYSETLKKYYNN